MLPDPSAPQRALALWQAGREAEAEALALAVLAHDPGDLLAANLAAAAALRRGDAEAALALADRAIAAAPSDHRAWNTRGLAAKALGRLDEAEAALRRAAELAPANSDVLGNLARLLLARGDAAAALAVLADAQRRGVATAALRREQERARLALLREAVDHHNAGDLAAADRLYRLVLGHCPEDHEALLFRAKVLRRQGAFDEAGTLLDRRLALGRDAAALEELGRLERARGRPERALAALAAALQAEPGRAATWHEHAAAALSAGRPVEAVASARRAVALAPEDLDARVTLAAALQAAGRLEEALVELEAARPLRPRPAVDGWLAGTLSLAGQLGRLASREAAAAELHALLDEPEVQARLAHELDPVLGMRFAFLLQFTGCSDERRWRFLRLLASRIDPRPRPRPPCPPPGPGGRLRIGYLSPNFGEHPTGHLLAPILEAHDRARVEVHLYSTMDRSGDPPPYPARLRAAADRFHELHGRDDAQVAGAIAADRLHVLVDLGGYLAGGRPGVLALRPAPIQLHWIMQLSGMPAPFVDASLVDSVMVPEDHPAGLHGRLIRLPDAFQPGYRQPLAAVPPSREASGLPAAGPVLCAFNNPLKIDTATFETWCAILRAVPEATLWLSAGPGGEPLLPLREAAAVRGVAPDRLRFAPRLADRALHLARQRHAALYLDTFPFGGATSAMDALLAGVPVLTCRGSQAYGRIGASFDTVLGVPELIAPDPRSYVATALALLGDPGRLAALRERVAAAVAHGPLFDAARFARTLEEIFARLVAEAQRPP